MRAPNAAHSRHANLWQDRYMSYGELIALYFNRSNALQWYWTIYVVVIGGLLAFSSLRQRPDRITGILVTILYLCFAYKNLGAIHDVTFERYAILAAIKDVSSTNTDIVRVRDRLEPELKPPAYDGPGGVRNFHIACDVLTVLALWGMELRRKRAWAERGRLDAPPAAA
jgi:hypothetical protein